ncbi:Sulfotransferase domain-containing protein [Shimia gijangensis]|uniref:Sulfotransferase domain-containing protein n=1 Tax=Shimia gijangensis TaxID=1470563 RepID=A0A1M6KVY6_9RHOB|nr:sulfotransferase domain-containing protein [Shimia gijangensis]SHJ63014.1 Sulfotransferase domain-containing protein [Shimia gijangensis]
MANQEQRRPYKGSITNTDRWAHFDHRPGDVFVCTPPKCGTTWTSTIVTMLCQGDTDIAPQDLIHWVDAEVIPLTDVTRGLAAQTGQRCIKTHTPFDGIPRFDDAHYIAVYRHPVDMLFSLRKHLANEKHGEPEDPYLGSSDAALRHFVESSEDPEDFDFDCLATFLAHYHSYAAQPRPANLLILHYADMLADPGKAIRQIAHHIGLSPDPAFLDAVQEATSFSSMKSQPERFTPFADQGFWRDPQAFFHSAGTHKWQGQLSDASMTLYHEKMRQSLPETQITWIENGGPQP